jgi:hypothetical protein
MDNPIFTTATAAAASRVPANTIKAWLGRAKTADAMSLLSPDHLEPETPGLRRDAARLFTRRGVYRFAVLGVLSRFGMSPTEALPHAMRVINLSLEGRTETCRFPDGETYMVVTDDGRSAVLNFTRDTSVDEVLHPVLPGVATDAMILIDIGLLLDRVDWILDSKK